MSIRLHLHPPSLPRPFSSPACNSALASDEPAIPSAVSLVKKPNDSGLVFREKLLYLQSLNVDPHKALRINPAVRSVTLTSIVSLEKCLSSFGLSGSAIGRILDMHPMLLTADPLPPINFLVKEVALKPPELPLSISRCPRILGSPVESQLRPALNFLRDLGLHVDAHTTLLLVSNVEKTLTPKVRFLEYVGFQDEEVREMVVRSPGLLTMSVEKNLVPKIRYFLDEMMGDLQELKEFPQFFSFSLERKIRPRHKALVDHGLKMSLPEMLKISDGEFSARLLEMRLLKADAR